jgi:hypothetical protein
MAPAAFAETVEITIMNTRGTDGIYRPALRVLRGGTVVFFNSGDAGLTEDIIRDGAALNAWLGANVPAGAGAEPVSFVVTKIESRPPVVKEEDPLVELEPEPEPGPEPEPEPTVKDCFDWEKNGECSKEERSDYCESQFPGIWRRDTLGWYENPKDYCFSG